jgi:hypothetical protein
MTSLAGAALHDAVAVCGVSPLTFTERPSALRL